MILEVAVLNVKPGLQKEFEKSFRLASDHISSIKGYMGLTLRKCLENENQYLLLVDWKDVESHEIGFRQSPAYLKWKELLHHYYEPFPTVEHYETIFEGIKK